MKKQLLLIFVIGLFFSGCQETNQPKTRGEINLSSQLFGLDAYYIYGYNFNLSDYIQYSYPFHGTHKPDLINEPFDNPDGSINAPGFNAPSGINGFYLLDEFSTLEEARNFYNGYQEVESQLEYDYVSDTVKLYQVWLQKTQLDHYVKMLVKNISVYNDDRGAEYVVVSIDFTYQDDGSSIFP